MGKGLLLNNEIFEQSIKSDYSLIKNHFKSDSTNTESYLLDDSITVEDVTEYNRLCFEIYQLNKTVSDYLKEVAIRITVINEKELFRVGGYDTIYDFVANTFGYSRRTCSRFFDIVHFFCVNIDGEYVFLDYYKDFTYTKLCLMLNIETEQLIKYGVTPDLSVRKIGAICKQIHEDNNNKIVGDVINNSDNNDSSGGDPDGKKESCQNIIDSNTQLNNDDVFLFNFKVEKHDNGIVFYEYNSITRKGRKECTNSNQFFDVLYKLFNKNISDNVGNYNISLKRV